MNNLHETVEIWNNMSIIQLQDRLDIGYDIHANMEEALEALDPDSEEFDALCAEVEENDLYLKVAEGIIALKHLSVLTLTPNQP